MGDPSKGWSHRVLQLFVCKADRRVTRTFASEPQERIAQHASDRSTCREFSTRSFRRTESTLNSMHIMGQRNDLCGLLWSLHLSAGGCPSVAERVPD